MEFNLKKLEPIWIELHGEEYPARMTNRAVKELTELWGIEYFDLFNKIAASGLSVDEILDVIFVTLKGGGIQLTREQLDDVEIDARFIEHANSKIIQLFDSSQRIVNVLEDDNEESEKDSKKK